MPKRGWDLLPPTATCELNPSILCGWAFTGRNYNEAVIAAHQHYRETGHLIRVEQIRTMMVGWETQSFNGIVPY